MEILDDVAAELEPVGQESRAGCKTDENEKRAVIMKDYSELDAAIVAEIQAGRGSFTAMSTALADKVKPHCTNNKSPFGDTPTWRVIDRRLQALRKAQRITYSRADGCWSLMDIPKKIRQNKRR